MKRFFSNCGQIAIELGLILAAIVVCIFISRILIFAGAVLANPITGIFAALYFITRQVILFNKEQKS